MKDHMDRFNAAVKVLAGHGHIKQRLIDAIDRAISYGAYNYKIVDRILKGGLDRLKEDEEPQT